MGKLNMEHVLIFAIVAFMLYHLSRCNCLNNGFRVGGIIAPSPTVGKGERCHLGFCDNPRDCPLCEDGLICTHPLGWICSGSCYGTCVTKKSTH